jgi:gelsolin
MSFSPDRVRVRGKSPAFNALAATFENPNTRNLSTPPPAVRKQARRSASPDPSKTPPRAASIAAISASFERPKPTLIPKSIKGTLASLERSCHILNSKHGFLIFYVLSVSSGS